MGLPGRGRGRDIQERPTSDLAKWQVWVQRDDDTMVEFVYKKDCLFQDTDNKIKNLAAIFFRLFRGDDIPEKNNIKERG